MQCGRFFINDTSYKKVSASGNSKPRKYVDRMVFLLS